MNVVVFDTETTSIDKPFVYNIGFVIYDTEAQKILHTANYVVEQIWHNAELFTTAYYSDKRAWYITEMRSRNIIMDKLGYITQAMARVFKQYEVQSAYAYNSPFDDRVFSFNCEWFHIINPFDDIPIYDIRGYVHKYIGFTEEYKKYCDDNAFYTEKGNYSNTAETVYGFITENPDFAEEHTALDDSLIELEILQYCINKGAEWNTEYKVYQSIPREVEKTLEVKDTDGNSNSFKYRKLRQYSEKDGKVKIILH